MVNVKELLERQTALLEELIKELKNNRKVEGEQKLQELGDIVSVIKGNWTWEQFLALAAGAGLSDEIQNWINQLVGGKLPAGELGKALSGLGVAFLGRRFLRNEFVEWAGRGAIVDAVGDFIRKMVKGGVAGMFGGTQAQTQQQAQQRVMDLRTYVEMKY